MTLGGRRILVTDAGLPHGLAIVRSLGAAGAHVVVADHEPASPAFRSRHAAGRVALPDPDVDPPAYADALAAGARAHGAELVIPVTDSTLVAVTEHPAALDGVLVAAPEPAALEAARDKAATVAVAERLGVPVPRTAVVATVEEALAAADGVRWPLVLKPQYSHQPTEHEALATFAVAFADDPEALRAAMASLEGRTKVLLQEFVPGIGVGVELLLHEGRPLAAFQHRRLREVPITGGMSSLRESADLDPELLAHAVALLGDMRWTGLAMVEFRVAPERTTLMEINGRVWGSMALPVRAGMDFPRRLAELYLHGPPPADEPLATSYRRGVRVRNVELELRWILAVGRQKAPHRYTPLPRRHEALVAAGGLLWPGNEFDVQVLADPRPGVADLRRAVRYLSGRLGR